MLMRGLFNFSAFCVSQIFHFNILSAKRFFCKFKHLTNNVNFITLIEYICIINQISSPADIILIVIMVRVRVGGIDSMK